MKVTMVIYSSFSNKKAVSAFTSNNMSKVIDISRTSVKLILTNTFDMGDQKLRNKIKALRKKFGITQEQLAKECSVVRQTINCIENNKYDPTLELAFKLSKILKVKVDELFTYEQI